MSKAREGMNKVSEISFIRLPNL